MLTEQHIQARLGYVTGSMVHIAMGKGKTRDKYMDRLIQERLTGIPSESEWTGNEYTEWGDYCEPLAIEAYEEATGTKVTKATSVHHPTIKWLSASPDGLIEGGCIEVKCMKSENHRKAIDKKIKSTHVYQMHCEMGCTGTFFCDYILFDPRMPLEWQLNIRRVKRDPQIVTKITIGIKTFLKELEQRMIGE